MRDSRLRRWLAIVVVFVVPFGPTVALAQEPRAGVVTTVEGQALLARPTLTQPVGLKFKDDLFTRDRVETKEDSIVRVLLGGKAVVTIRELSVFTVTEEPGRAAVDLRSGKLAVGVAKSLLRPGELIEIRTPNAVAGIRGSLLVAEVAEVGGVPQSAFTALQATVPITIATLDNPNLTVSLSPNQTVSVSGAGAAATVGPVLNITPAQAQRAAATAAAPRQGGQATTSLLDSQMTMTQVAQATQLATLIAPASQTPLNTAGAVSMVPPPSTAQLGVNETEAGVTAEVVETAKPGEPTFNVFGLLSVLDGTTLTGPSPSPLLSFDGSSVDQSGNIVTIRRSPSTSAPSTLILSGPLLSAVNGSSFNTSSLGLGAACCSFVSITQGGRLVGTGTTPLIQLSSSTVNAGPDAQSGGSFFNVADTFTNAPSSELVAPSSVSLAGPLVRADNSTITTLFHLLRVGNSALTSTSPDALIQLNGSTVSLGGTDPFTNAPSAARALNLSGTSSSPGTVMLRGPLFSAVNSTISNTSELFGFFGGSLTTTGTADPLISFSGGSVNSGNHMIHLFGFGAGGSLPTNVVLADPLLSVTGTTINVHGNLVRIAEGGTLSSTTTSPLVSFQGGSFTGGPFGSGAGSSLLRMVSQVGQSPTSLSLAGPYLSASGATFNNPDAPTFNIGDGAVINSTTSAPFASFTNSSVTAASSDVVAVTAHNSFGTPPVQGSGEPPVVTIAGTLIQGINSTFSNGNPGALAPTGNTASFMFVADSAQVTTTGTAPLLSFDHSTVDTAGNILTLRQSNSASSPTTLRLAGPLFSAVNGSSFNATSLGFPGGAACCGGFFIGQGAQLSSTSTAALIQLANSTFSSGPDVQSGHNFFSVADTGGFPGNANQLVAPSSVSLGGPFLSATGSTVTALFNFLSINRSSFTSSSPNPLIQLDGSTVSLGGTNPFAPETPPFGRLLVVISSGTAGTSASPASASLAGQVLNANNSTLTMVSDVVGVFNGASLASTTSLPLLQLGNTALTAGTSTIFGSVLQVNNVGGPGGAVPASVALNGPLLVVSNGSSLNLTGGLFGAFNGGQATVIGSSAPFVSITGGTHSLATNAGNAMFQLFGRSTATAVDPETELILGTGKPLQQGGVLLETSAATVTGQQVVRIDTALLEATAPLLNLKAGSVMTSSVDAINLNSRANVSLSGSDLVRLDASVLNVSNGALARVAGGSKLTVGGSLVNLLNGATLTIFNGPLITVSGSSFVNITGSLISFGGTGGNKVNITNSLCPCSIIGGVPVALKNGALAANVQITNPIKNAGLGQLNLSSENTALAVVNGANTKLTVSGK